MEEVLKQPIKSALKQTSISTGGSSTDLNLGSRSTALRTAVGRWGIGAAARA